VHHAVVDPLERVIEPPLRLCRIVKIDVRLFDALVAEGDEPSGVWAR